MNTSRFHDQVIDLQPPAELRKYITGIDVVDAYLSHIRCSHSERFQVPDVPGRLLKIIQKCSLPSVRVSLCFTQIVELKNTTLLEY